MEAIEKFLRRKPKSEYETRKGRIRLLKSDKEKVKRFKSNKAIGEFRVERPIETSYVASVMLEPIRKPLTGRMREKVETQRERDKEKLYRRIKKTEWFEERAKTNAAGKTKEYDVWADNLEPRRERFLQRRMARPTGAGAYDGSVGIGSLRSGREEMWRRVHFYKDCVRLPGISLLGLEKVKTKAVPPPIKVPRDVGIPTEAVNRYMCAEGVRDVFVLQGVYYLAVHSSSVTLIDSESHMPQRHVRFVKGTAPAMLRSVSISPRGKKVAFLIVEEGIVMMDVSSLLSITVCEKSIDLSVKSTEYTQMFGEKTFRLGAWHPKGTYFAALWHGKVVIVNSESKKALFFYRGTERIQNLYFHPTENVLVLTAPSNMYFYSLSPRKRLEKFTVKHIPGTTACDLSFGSGMMVVGTGANNVLVFEVENNYNVNLVRYVYTADIPQKISLHREYPYGAVFDGGYPVLVYLGHNKNLDPLERTGAVHKYAIPYSTGTFHPQLPHALFAVGNVVELLVPAKRMAVE
jgi:hypothetical protein